MCEFSRSQNLCKFILILDHVPFQIIPNRKKKSNGGYEAPITLLWVCGNYREEILHQNKDFVLTCDINIEALCAE